MPHVLWGVVVDRLILLRSVFAVGSQVIAVDRLQQVAQRYIFLTAKDDRVLKQLLQLGILGRVLVVQAREEQQRHDTGTHQQGEEQR